MKKGSHNRLPLFIDPTPVLYYNYNCSETFIEKRPPPDFVIGRRVLFCIKKYPTYLIICIDILQNMWYYIIVTREQQERSP